MLLPWFDTVVEAREGSAGTEESDEDGLREVGIELVKGLSE